MREVAVTEGDKVAAQMQFGYSVNGYGVGDLVQVRQRGHRRARSTRSSQEYEDSLRRGAGPAQRRRHGTSPCAKRRASKLGLRAFLNAGGFKGFTTTFEDLHGLAQLPGLAVAAPDGRRLRLRRGRRLEDLPRWCAP